MICEGLLFCALRYQAGTGSVGRPYHPHRHRTRLVYFRIVEGARAKLWNLAAAVNIQMMPGESSLILLLWYWENRCSSSWRTKSHAKPLRQLQSTQQPCALRVRCAQLVMAFGCAASSSLGCS